MGRLSLLRVFSEKEREREREMRRFETMSSMPTGDFCGRGRNFRKKGRRHCRLVVKDHPKLKRNASSSSRVVVETTTTTRRATARRRHPIIIARARAFEDDDEEEEETSNTTRGGEGIEKWTPSEEKFFVVPKPLSAENKLEGLLPKDNYDAPVSDEERFRNLFDAEKSTIDPESLNEYGERIEQEKWYNI